MGRRTGKPLSERQELFCQEYMKHHNATRAYLAAYESDSEFNAGKKGSQVLKSSDVQARIMELQADRAYRNQIDSDRVLLEIARIAFTNITDVVSFNDESMTITDSDELAEDVKSAIAEVSIKDTKFGVNRNVKMHDKSKALAVLCQHLGLTNDFNGAIACLRKYGLYVSQSEDGKWGLTDENE
jgi:phage terminase small subunit